MLRQRPTKREEAAGTGARRSAPTPTRDAPSTLLAAQFALHSTVPMQFSAGRGCHAESHAIAHERIRIEDSGRYRANGGALL